MSFFRSRGGTFMMELSGSSYARDVAGTSSVSKSMHSVSSEPMGWGVPANAQSSTGTTSGTRWASV